MNDLTMPQWFPLFLAYSNSCRWRGFSGPISVDEKGHGGCGYDSRYDENHLQQRLFRLLLFQQFRQNWKYISIAIVNSPSGITLTISEKVQLEKSRNFHRFYSEESAGLPFLDQLLIKSV